MFEWLADKTLARVGRFRAAQSECEANDRRIGDINRDLRRWVVDRDGELATELQSITSAAPYAWKEHSDPDEGSQLYSGAHVAKRAAAQRVALHQYRDEASQKQREVREILAGERRGHRFWRRRRGGSPPRLALTAECASILRRWRQPAKNPAEVVVGAAKGDPPVVIRCRGRLRGAADLGRYRTIRAMIDSGLWEP